ncbi:MAG: hypothetical protein U0793_01015 [Gemmataceae bacterium]
MDNLDDLTPEQKFAAEDPETMVPRLLMKGYRRQQIVIELVRLDWTPEAAHALIARVENDLRRFYASPESRRRLVAEARRQMWGGLLMTIFGVVVAFISFLSWALGVAPMILFFGFIGVGLVFFARGYQRTKLYKGERLPFEPDEGPAEDMPP